MTTSVPRIPCELRLGSSVCLAVTAWVWFQGTLGTPIEDFALWFALGASLSCLGDFIIVLVRAEHAQQVGLLVFMTAHSAYISGMIGLISNTALDISRLFTMIAAIWVWILMGMAAWYLRVYRGGGIDAVRATPLVYAILVSVTAGVATALTFQNSSFLLIALGAALLWISELIVAPQLLRNQEPSRRLSLLGDLVWLTYGPGQMLLVLGLAVALLTFAQPFVSGLP